MAKKDDRIGNRLAAITRATPTIGDVRIPELKSKRVERSPREAVFRPGKVYLSKTDMLRCVIRNISETGAYIHLEGAHPLPPVVLLHFNQTGVTKKAKVAWQNDIEAGLHFIGDINTGAAKPPG